MIDKRGDINSKNDLKKKIIIKITLKLGILYATRLVFFQNFESNLLSFSKSTEFYRSKNIIREFI